MKSTPLPPTFARVISSGLVRWLATPEGPDCSPPPVDPDWRRSPPGGGALVIKITNAAGEFLGVHKIYLDAEGRNVTLPVDGPPASPPSAEFDCPRCETHIIATGGLEPPWDVLCGLCLLESQLHPALTT
jgi:hypothetical protein